MSKYLRKSKIGYLGVGADGRPVDWYWGWNPGGMGCSGGCDGCWSRKLAKRNAFCEDCREFRVHLHAERLGQPWNTRKPGVVLCNFTNDWLDRFRAADHVRAILAAMGAAPRHRYITLTKNVQRLSHAYQAQLAPNIYLGLTVTRQPKFWDIPKNVWLSLEPIQGEITFGNCLSHACGVLVGHDNRRGAPGTDTLDHIRSAVEQCDAAGIAVMVKQLHWRGKFLRASHPEEFAQFPPDLQRNRLPWSLPEGAKR